MDKINYWLNNNIDFLYDSKMKNTIEKPKKEATKEDLKIIKMKAQD
jgi:hypothetical protein